ncbi:hypothetical protein BD779DRAFT_1801776 [Infundibulicybe gibba]|nr:hypothetical protein BD779DRAFT_1801776 [Infundibulicybe gibba]
MLFTSKLALSIAASFCALVSAQTDVVASVAATCEGRVVTSETFIGKDKNVKMETFSCSDTTKRSVDVNLDARQTTPTNVCGANCATNCFLPAGGGPNPNDCQVISNALLFDSQNVGAIFPIGTGTNNTIALTFRSCETFFVNQTPGPLAYCRTDWSAVAEFVAFNCQATQNAHGGNCVAADQRWFIQVQHS